MSVGEFKTGQTRLSQVLSFLAQLFVGMQILDGAKPFASVDGPKKSGKINLNTSDYIVFV